MKINYKKIHTIRKQPEIVDHYYGLTTEDFYSEEDIQLIEQDRIRAKLQKAAVTRGSIWDVPFRFCADYVKSYKVEGSHLEIIETLHRVES